MINEKILEHILTKKQIKHIKSNQMDFIHYFNEYTIWDEEESTSLLGDLKD